MLAGDGEFQGAPLEKILHLHQRDPGGVLGLSEAPGGKEGEGPRTSPSLQDQGPWEFRNGCKGIGGIKAQGRQWARVGTVG